MSSVFFSLWVDTYFFYDDRSWHPCQTGLILATSGLLKIREITVCDPDCPVQYLLPSRASLDPCEERSFAGPNTDIEAKAGSSEIGGASASEAGDPKHKIAQK